MSIITENISARSFLKLIGILSVALVFVGTALFFFSKPRHLFEEYIRIHSEKVINSTLPHSTATITSVSIKPFLLKLTFNDVKLHSPVFSAAIPSADVRVSLSRILTARPFIVVRINEPEINFESTDFSSFSSSSTSMASEKKNHRRKSSSPVMGPIGGLEVEGGKLSYRLSDDKYMAVLQEIFAGLRIGRDNDISGIIRASGSNKNTRIVCRFYSKPDSSLGENIATDIFVKNLDILRADSIGETSRGGYDMKIKARYFLSSGNLEIDNFKIHNPEGFEVSGDGVYRKETGVRVDGRWRHPSKISDLEGKFSLCGYNGNRLLDLRILSDGKESSSTDVSTVIDIGIRADFAPQLPSGVIYRIFTPSAAVISDITIGDSGYKIKKGLLNFDALAFSSGVSSATLSFSGNIFSSVEDSTAIPSGVIPIDNGRVSASVNYYSSSDGWFGDKGRSDIKIFLNPPVNEGKSRVAAHLVVLNRDKVITGTIYNPVGKSGQGGSIELKGHLAPRPDINFDFEGFDMSSLSGFVARGDKTFSGRIYCKKALLMVDEKFNWHLDAPTLVVRGFSVGKKSSVANATNSPAVVGAMDFSADVYAFFGGKDENFFKVEDFKTMDGKLKGAAEFYGSGRKRIELYARDASLEALTSFIPGADHIGGVLDGRLTMDISQSDDNSRRNQKRRKFSGRGAVDLKITSLTVGDIPLGDMTVSSKFYPSSSEEFLMDIFCDRIIIKSPDPRGGGVSGGFSVVNGRIKGLFGFNHYALDFKSKKDSVSSPVAILDGKISAAGSFKGVDNFEMRFESLADFLIEKPIVYQEPLKFNIVSKGAVMRLSGLKFGAFTTGDEGITITTEEAVQSVVVKNKQHLSGSIFVRGLPLTVFEPLFKKEDKIYNTVIKNGALSELNVFLGGYIENPIIKGGFRVVSSAVGKNASDRIFPDGTTSVVKGKNDIYPDLRLIGRFDYEYEKKRFNLSGIRLSLLSGVSFKETGYAEAEGYYDAWSGLKFSGRIAADSVSEIMPLFGYQREDFSSGPVKADFRISGGDVSSGISPVVIDGVIETTAVKKSPDATLVDRIKLVFKFSDGKLEVPEGLFRRSDFFEFKLTDGSFADLRTGNYRTNILVGRLKSGPVSAIGRISLEGKYYKDENSPSITAGILMLEDFWIGAKKFSKEKILFDIHRDNTNSTEILLKSPTEKPYQFYASFLSNLTPENTPAKDVLLSEFVIPPTYSVINLVKVRYREKLFQTKEEAAGAFSTLDATVLIGRDDSSGKSTKNRQESSGGIAVMAKATRFPVEYMTHIISDEMPFEISGLADINIDLKSDARDGISGSCAIEMIDGGSVGGISFDELKANASLADGVLLVPSAYLVKSGSYRMTASGRLVVGSSKVSAGKGLMTTIPKNDFTISLADGRLSMIEGLDFVKKADGLLSAKFEIKGTASDPRVTGFMKIENGSAELKMYLAKIQNLNLLATFKDNIVKVEEFSGRSGAGRFLFQGTARLENFAVADMDFSFKTTTAEGIDFFVPELPIPTQFSKETGTKFISSYSYGKPKCDLTIKGDPRSRFTLGGWVRLDNTYFSYPPPPTVSVGEDPLKETLSKLELDLVLSAGENTWYENELASVNILGEISLKGNYYAPYVKGAVESKRGYISYLGTDFKIQTARLDVSGEEAYLEGTATKEIASSRKSGEYDTVHLVIDRALIGKIQPRFISSDDPSLPSEKVVARVLGVNVENSSPEERDLVLRQGLVRLLDSSLATPFAKTLLRKSGLVDMMKVSYAQPLQGESGGKDSTMPSASSDGTSTQSQGGTLPDLLRGTKYTFEKYLTDQMLLGYSVTLDEYLNKLDLRHEIEVAYRWKGNVFLRGIYELDSKTLIRPPERRITIEQQWRFGWPKKDDKSHKEK